MTGRRIGLRFELGLQPWLVVALLSLGSALAFPAGTARAASDEEAGADEAAARLAAEDEAAGERQAAREEAEVEVGEEADDRDVTVEMRRRRAAEAERELAEEEEEIAEEERAAARREAMRRRRDREARDEEGGAWEERDELMAREEEEDERPRRARRPRRDWRDYSDDEWFADSGRYRRSSYRGYPSFEVHDAVRANARAAYARAVFRQAESALGAAIRRAKRTHENSEQFREAVAAENKAYQAYTSARRAATKSLVEDPEYQTLIGLRDDIASQIRARRNLHQTHEDQGAPDYTYTDDILALATLKMNYAAEARALETEALENDESFREAKAKLRAAGTRLARMRAEFDEDMRNDPDLIAAREALAEARIARVTEAAYLQGAISAADEALDFAYYLHRYDGRRYDDFRYDYPYHYARYRY